MTAARPKVTHDDIVEAMMNIIEPHIKQLDKDGFMTQSCQYHGSEFVEYHGGEELCNECIADGGTGELCSIGTDSLAIEIAESLLKKFTVSSKEPT